ncbi:MAG: hypothetical protein E7020_06520 [Alphaproteobacteria bacterium]|nr:hypothetical protein [Alphaproteobacteria bacterium]
MLKTSFKAFVYSFSVSLFAIISANRAIRHEDATINHPLNIEDKNIVLFLKNTVPLKHPSKKIALTSLPELNKKVDILPYSEPDVILASEFDDFDFPLEIVPAIKAQEDIAIVAEGNNEATTADILYAPDKPLETKQVDAEIVYQHDAFAVKLSAPPPSIQDDYNKKSFSPPETSSTASSKSEIALANARNAELESIPLSKGNNSTTGKKVNIGDPANLNHIAMNSANIPIQSMEKESISLDENSNQKSSDWNPLNDSPWLVAKSSGSKNLMSIKEFGNKTDKEIAEALDIKHNRPEIKLASETVKNIVIPIPKDIMQKEDLTPKLAYPATSEDAQKEKIIDSEIKKQMETPLVEKKEQSLLVPIEDDVSLDVVNENKIVETPPTSNTKAKTSEDKNSKSGIMNALNSIFSRSVKPTADAKEKAIAKAQAKRSVKKRIAKNRPVSIMPTEIRLSFQPNRAEISGQTLRWVQAFATKAAETPSMTLEIRIDGTSATELQQRRLNLLYNILTNKGVEYSKINTVFTSREPNSFILRTTNIDNANKGETAGKNNNHRTKEYIQW